MSETQDGLFQREIKEHWYVKYTERNFPHVQQGWVLPPGREQDFDPFIIMAEDWFKRGTFSDHPHRGFQTLTYVIDGRLEHKDNHGGHSIIEAGDVQYMNAGSGARHAEEAVGNDIAHTLQLWLNLPKQLKGTQTSYQNIYVDDVPHIPIDGGEVKVYAGSIIHNKGVIKGPLESLVPITMVEIKLAEGATYLHHIPENHNAFVYVLAGEVELGETQTQLKKTGVALLTFNEEGNADKDSQLFIKAKGRAKLLIYSGAPIKEEIVAYGPFVMNSMEEIKEAYHDFQSGKFGPPVD